MRRESQYPSIEDVSDLSLMSLIRYYQNKKGTLTTKENFRNFKIWGSLERITISFCDSNKNKQVMKIYDFVVLLRGCDEIFNGCTRLDKEIVFSWNAVESCLYFFVC
jgi:hypothetical protein